MEEETRKPKIRICLGAIKYNSNKEIEIISNESLSIGYLKDIEGIQIIDGIKSITLDNKENIKNFEESIENPKGSKTEKTLEDKENEMIV